MGHPGVLLIPARHAVCASAEFRRVTGGRAVAGTEYGVAEAASHLVLASRAGAVARPRWGQIDCTSSYFTSAEGDSPHAFVSEHRSRVLLRMRLT